MYIYIHTCIHICLCVYVEIWAILLGSLEVQLNEVAYFSLRARRSFVLYPGAVLGKRAPKYTDNTSSLGSKIDRWIDRYV